MRNRSLDVIRGIAILLVIGAHIRIPEGAEGVFFDFARFLEARGSYGVHLFFVLSGFLISGLLFKELDKRHTIDIKTFLIRRAFKIYPLYFIFISYAIWRDYSALLRDSAPAAGDLINRYLPALLFYQNYVPAAFAGHTWSIAVEEHFYIALPIAMLCLRRKVSPKAWGWLVLLPLLTIPSKFIFLHFLSGSVQYDTSHASHMVFDSLALGVGLKALDLSNPGFLKLGRYARIGLLLLGLSAICIAPYYPERYSNILPIKQLFSICIFLTLYAKEVPQLPILADRFSSLIAAIGVYSYAIYLWHVTVIRTAESRLAKFTMFSANIDVFWPVSMVLIYVTCIGVGWIMTKAIEEPALRLRDKMTAKA